MSELRTYLEARNAETEAWVNEDPSNRWAGLYVTDLEHWAEYGIHTVEQFERHEMIESYYNLYKDFHGIKPRWVDFDSMSNEQVRGVIDSLYESVEAAQRAQEKREEYALAEFEALLEKMRNDHGITSATAIRWLMEAAEEIDYDYFFYRYNLGRADRQFYYEVAKGEI